MVSEIKKMPRKDTDIGLDYFGEASPTMCDCPSGKYISVDDLKEWINWHLKERTISTIYSDLEEALK